MQPHHAAQRLRQRGEAVHRRQSRPQHAAHAVARVQPDLQPLDVAEPARREAQCGDVVDAECNHGHVEWIGRRLLEQRERLARGDAGAGHQSPVEWPADRLAEQRGEPTRQRVGLHRRADPRSRGIADDQQPQRPADAVGTDPALAGAFGLGQLRRVAAHAPTLPDEQRREQQGRGEAERTAHQAFSRSERSREVASRRTR